MYSYSPIKQMRVKNFRNIGEATVDFNDSPIISLVGENESGKTSIVKAFGVAAIHADPRSQKDYIRDGTTGFGVEIELEDGTKITRIKTTNSGNIYKVNNPDGSIAWEADKLENDVPKAVQKVMGLIEEPETKEFLHIRTYEDQLLFVNTSASTNYKVMYNALKISQITKAIKAGSTEANQLKSAINDVDSSVLTLNRSLVEIKTFDIEPLLNIKNKLVSELQVMDKLDRAVELMESIEHSKKKLGALELLDKEGIKAIDVAEVMRIQSIDRMLEDIESKKKVLTAYNEIINAKPIDTQLYNKIESAYERADEVSRMNKESKTLIDLSNAETVSVNEVALLNRVESLVTDLKRQKELEKVYSGMNARAIDTDEFTQISKMDKVIQMKENIGANKKSLMDIDKYIDSVVSWMKAVGVATTTCPKCGESVIIDVSILNQ